MATNTSHLGLVKPAYTDAADVTVINNNMDTIDTAISHILPVITGSTNNSGYTIATGHYFEANGSVYKATASIGTGSSWSGNASAVSGTALNAAFDSLSSKIANSVRVVITTGSTSVAKNGWSEINWASDDVLCLGTLYGASHDSNAFWFSSNPTSRKFNIYNSYSGTSSQTVSYMLAHFKLI